MFADVEHAAVIFRNRPKADTERLVLIIPFQPDQLSSCLLMRHFIHHTFGVGDFTNPVNSESVGLFAYIAVHICLLRFNTIQCTTGLRSAP